MNITFAAKVGTALILALAMVSLAIGGLPLQLSAANATAVASVQAASPEIDFVSQMELITPVRILVDDFLPQPLQGDSEFTPAFTIYLPSVSHCWGYQREAENPNDYSIGQMIYRSNASNKKVHGQFGTTPTRAARSGYVKYSGINIDQLDHLYLMLRYSKYSSSDVPIEVYLDNESTPRATLYLENQESWNKFSWKILSPTNTIDLGAVISGTHSIKFYTDGQKDGVADLDKFVLKSCP